MSLIFSKENRILFNDNRKNSDSLLELTYNNRLIPLRNIITTKVKKENKASFKLSSKIFFDIHTPKDNFFDEFADNSSQRVIEENALGSPILNSRKCNIPKIKAFKNRSFVMPRVQYRAFERSETSNALSKNFRKKLLKINNYLFLDRYTVMRWLSMDHILKNAMQRFIINWLFSISFQESKSLQPVLQNENDKYLKNIFSVLQPESTFLKLSENNSLFQVNPKLSLTSYLAEVSPLGMQAVAKRSFALNEVFMRFSKNYHFYTFLQSSALSASLLDSPQEFKSKNPDKVKTDPSFSRKKESGILLRKNTAFTTKGHQTNLQNQEYKDKNSNVGVFLKNLIFRNHFHTRQKLVPHFLTFKKKVDRIKKRVPQVNKWSFAFGSSFLLVIMISILERQELSMWYFSFLKRQIPGVYTFYEEASWESFENIISKYLIKNNSISFADAYKAPLCKHLQEFNPHASSKNRAYLLKKLDLQKDSLQLDFSKVWGLQLRKDFIGVFPVSKDFRRKSLASLSREFDRSSQKIQSSRFAQQSKRMRSALSTSQASGDAPTRTHQREITFGNASQGTGLGTKRSFESTSSEPLYNNFNTYKSAICKKVPRLQRSFLESFYEMNARIPCHHLLNAPKTNQSLLFSIRKRNFVKPKSFKRFTKNNVFKERVFCKNNSIPSKMSSSVTTVFANNYKIRSRMPSLLKSRVFEAFKEQESFLKKNKKDQSKPGKISEKKNDILKKFFYEYGFFYIPTQALSTPSPEEDFLKASEFKAQLQETISSQLYCYARENFKELSTKCKSSCFENLATVSSKGCIPENDASYKMDRIRDELSKPALNGELTEKENFQNSYREKRDQKNLSNVKNCITVDGTTPSPFLQSEALNENSNQSPLYIFPIAPNNNNPQLLTAPIEKISCYTLRRTHELKPRLLSGYKSAEIKPFEQSLAYKSLISRQTKKFFNKKVLIKIPPTLPCFSREFFSKFQCCTPTFSKSNKEEARVYNKRFISKNLDEYSQNKIGKVRPFKKIPYKQLALDEFQEIKSLFEKISKENRISPHNLTFKNPFFTDYNDYLNRPKDSPGAIAISPSLEEDQSIQQSWIDHTEKQRSVNQTLEKRKQNFENNNFWGSSKEKDSYTNDPSLNEKKLEQAELDKSSLLSPSLSSLHDNDAFSVHKQQGANLKMPFSGKDQSSSSVDRDSNTVINQVFFESQNEDDRNSGADMDEEKELNEEEKKKEITKWEWLHSVRESELNVEKRKEFQKLAYPNKEALFTKRLQEQTALKTPVFRNLQNFFVSDRKSSFFGITNLFPKRLIAEDQRQINNQILRKDYDQRNVHFFIPLNEKKLHIKQNFSQLPEKNHTCIADSELLFLEQADFKKNSNPKKKKVSKNKLLEREDSSNRFTNALQIAPRLLYEEAPKVDLQASKSCYQHPIYTPNRRLRLRMADLSKSAQNNNPQARVDYLNSCQSHRWWQKRRVTSSLLGAPSKRYMVMPEITRVEWRKIIEWQLKTYFLEEEKRLQPLIVSKGAFKKAPDSSLSQQGVDNNFSLTQETHSGNSLISKFPPQEIIFDPERSRDLKIKKIAIYLPWVTLKKTLKKPFEWPLTRLSYQSLAGTYKEARIRSPHSCEGLRTAFACLATQGTSKLSRTAFPASEVRGISETNLRYASDELCKKGIDPQNCMIGTPDFVHNENKVEETILFSKNRKPDLCLISPLSPNRQALPFTFTIGDNNIGKINRDKHFIFEMISKDSHLLFHQLLLAIAIKQIFQKIYHLFGKIITDKIKNSSFSLALLPLFFNAYSHKNQISGVYNLNKRLKDLVGSEDSISSLSEIVWYLRNSCRGRMVPRGVVLLETEDSESTEFLKAVGGEAQVPVIVESLRALPFTQNHPQQRLEKILKFAEKSAPCILFLDDLDAIGKERSLLINENGGANSISSDTASLQRQKGNHNTFLSSNKSSNLLRNAGGVKIANEKEKWKVYKNDLIASNNLEIKKTIGLTNITKQSNVKRYFSTREGKKASNYARPVFGKYNMFLKTLLFQKTKSQEAHTFLLNSFRASTKSSNGAYLTGARTPLNVNESSSVGPETERLMEQRRLDLMLRLLTVMDGISHLKGVLIVTTSKNPSSLDPALLRPGRFERFIHLKLPNKKRRIQLLKVQTSKIGHVNPMPWEYFGKEIENMSGTSISNAINHSAFKAIIQSTAHTPTTLEYGINRVKGVKTSRVNEGRVSTSFVDPFCKEAKTEFLRPYKIAHTNLRFALKSSSIPLKSEQKGCKSFGLPRSCLATQGKRTRYARDKSANPRYAGVCSCLATQGKRTRFANPRVARVCYANQSGALYATARYQAGKGILQGLLDSNKQKELLNLKFSDFTENFIKLHAGRASEALYLTSKSRTSQNTYQFLQLNQSYLEQIEAVFSTSSVLNEQTKFQFLGTRHNFDFKEIKPNFKSFLVSTPLTTKIYKNPLQQSSDFEHKMTSFGFFSKNLRFLACLQSSCLANASLMPRYARQANAVRESLLMPHSCPATQGKRTRYAKQANAVSEASLREYRQGDTAHSVPRICAVSPWRYSRTAFAASEVRQQRHISSSAQFLGINKDYWFEEKICETLKTFKKSQGNWYRLYLPELSDSKSNREWRIPDRFFDQSLSLLDIKSIFQSAKQTVLNNTDLSYYNVVLSSFYISFQSLNENRELLDLFADHLLRFKSLRTHEIMRISLFYMDASSFY